MGCGDVVEEDSQIFTKNSQRCCTDFLCLILLFIPALAATIFVTFFALGEGNIDNLIYPQDKYGNYCGKTAAVADKPYAFFPSLDQDITSQMVIILAGAWWNFRPTILCVESCPAAFSLTKPEQFGGPDYPGANTAAANTTHYALNPTTPIYTYCLPSSISQPGLNREICSIPNCTSTLNVCGFEVTCTEVDSDPDANGVAWSFSPTNTTEAGCCEFSVQEVNTQRFLPADATAESAYYEEMFASYVSSAFGVLRAIQESSTIVYLMGLAAPFGFAIVWFIFLFLFAGPIIVCALLMFWVAMVLGAIYFIHKGVSVDGADLVSTATSLFNGTSVTATDSSDMNQIIYLAVGVVFAISAVIYIILMILWRQSIYRCILIVEEVCKVLKALPFMTIWPLVSVGFQLLVFLYFIVVMMLILSQSDAGFDTVANALADAANGTDSGAGDAVAAALTSLTSMDSTLLVAIQLLIHFVACLLGYYMVLTGTYTTLSRSAACWYFSHGKDETSGEVVQKGTFFFGTRIVVCCAWCVIAHHLGTVCFSAAVLTVCTILRIVMEALDYYVQKYAEGNTLLKLLMKCLKCVVWCITATIQKVTYFGLIFTAIKGSSFCGGCGETFKFVTSNSGLFSVNLLVSNILSFVISYAIPTTCAVIGFFIIDGMGAYGPMYCSVVIFVQAWIICAGITDAFKVCIDTITVSAIDDFNLNVPPKFMSESLRKGFDLNNLHKNGETIEKNEGDKKSGTQMTDKI